MRLGPLPKTIIFFLWEGIDSLDIRAFDIFKKLGKNKGRLREEKLFLQILFRALRLFRILIMLRCDNNLVKDSLKVSTYEK